MVKNVFALAGIFCYSIVMLFLIIISFRNEHLNRENRMNTQQASFNQPSNDRLRAQDESRATSDESLRSFSPVVVVVAHFAMPPQLLETDDLPPMYENCPSYEEYSQNI